MVDAKDITFKSSQLENTPPLNLNDGIAKNRRKSKLVEKDEFSPSKSNPHQHEGDLNYRHQSQL